MKLISSLRTSWRDLSVSKKLFSVVGVMGLLIAMELLTLRFAMHTLSSVRAFVGAEGNWSKAQKSAVLDLEMYARTRDPKYYALFQRTLGIPLGDRAAREELLSGKPNLDRVREGFLQGEVHPDDIEGVIHLVRRFGTTSHLAKAIEIWGRGNDLLAELITIGDHLHRAMASKNSPAQIHNLIQRMDALDAELTGLETEFSATLGEGSRWLESVLLQILFLAVLTVECTGVLLTLSLSRTLSRSLKEICKTTEAVGSGDFTRRLEIHSRDEFGQLANAINTMTEKLADTLGGQREAERASQEKSQFLAHMSHEIRTPLSAILGFSELLRDENLSKQERSEYLDIIDRTGKNLSHLINDILDLSKVEAGKMEVETSVFSLANLFDEVRELLEPRCREKSIRFEIAPHSDVPDQILSDPHRVRQILINLVSNAIKFTSQGYVQIACEIRGTKLAFLVRDTGRGLGPNEAENLFKAFVQPARPKQSQLESTGLGLTLSKHLARLLGGDLWLEQSREGEGSTFIAEISLISATEHPLAPTTELNEKPLELGGRKLLVVEDSFENQMLLQRLLSRRGALVTVASDGEQGLREALVGGFDLILMDLQMPVMDGLAAVRFLRENHYIGPIIALTAHAMKEDRAICLESGFNDYLTKPIETAQLFATIGRHLEAEEDFDLAPPSLPSIRDAWPTQPGEFDSPPDLGAEPPSLDL